MSHSRFKTTVSTFLASVEFAALQLAFPTVAKAQTSSWGGVCVDVTNPDVATLQGLQCLIANILSVSLTLLGLTGFVMLIIGSMRWLLSGGNAQGIEKSRQTLTFAVVGIIVALSSFIILRLVAQFTGVNSIMNFKIPDSGTCWPSGNPSVGGVCP